MGDTAHCVDCPLTLYAKALNSVINYAYVMTSYQRKGDPFTLKVLEGKGPRTVQKRRHWRTGREYFTRVLVEDCPLLHVQDVQQELAAKAGSNFERAKDWAVEWWPQRKVFSVRPAAEVEDFTGILVPLKLSMVGNDLGWRLWLACPHCGKRSAALYVSQWDNQGQEGASLTGCRQCLGLTDWAKQNHKRPRWAAVVLNEQEEYQARSPNTKARATELRINSVGVLAYWMLHRVRGEHSELRAALNDLSNVRKNVGKIVI